MGIKEMVMRKILEDEKVVEILEKARCYEDFRFYWGDADLERIHNMTPSEKDWKTLKSLHEDVKPAKILKMVKTDKSSSWWKGVLKIVEEKQWAKIQGVRVDLSTASILKRVGEGINEDNFKRFTSLPIEKAAGIAWKVANGK